MSRESVRQKQKKELFRGVTMEINKQLAKELEVQEWQVDAAVKLIDEGNTIPFISRYRKEATGSLNDEVLRKLFERLTYLRNLEEKKQQVLSVIEEQGKLTPELKKQILAAETLVVVDDLYRHKSLCCQVIGDNHGNTNTGKRSGAPGKSHPPAADEASAGGRCQSFSF